MKVVILAGGMGTRISEETSLRPKPMIHIGAKPNLWHILKMYSHHGINEFIICCRIHRVFTINAEFLSTDAETLAGFDWHVWAFCAKPKGRLRKPYILDDLETVHGLQY